MTAPPKDDLDGDYAAAGFGGDVPPGVRPVLLLIDFARAYFDPAASLFADVDDERTVAARLRSAARRAGIPVIFTRVEYDRADPGLARNQFYRKVAALRNFDKGNPMADFTAELAPLDGDRVITKTYPSAFFGTALADELKALRIDTVVIAGLSTSGCVRATALDALCHGFVPVVVEDGCGDRDKRVHDANIFDLKAKYATVTGSAAILDYFARINFTPPA
jgi:maleamate amidohydrolase